MGGNRLSLPVAARYPGGSAALGGFIGKVTQWGSRPPAAATMVMGWTGDQRAGDCVNPGHRVSKSILIELRSKTEPRGR